MIEKNSKNIIPIIYHEGYSTEFPIEHRFVMRKFPLLVEVLQKEGILSENNLYTPNLINREDLLLAHEKSYVDRVLTANLSKEELREYFNDTANKMLEKIEKNDKKKKK